MTTEPTLRRKLAIALMLVLVALTASIIDVSAGKTIEGRANYAVPSHGNDYLAIRADRGTRVQICGAGGCKNLRSTDYGPAKRTGDIADISLYWFARLCGYYDERADDPYAKARSMGECDVTIEFLGKSSARTRAQAAVPTLPPTDTDPVQIFHREHR